ncbi:MAG TPA: DUF4149 domain-containing protein [Aggregatilineales bacterium]|nr:DUF4149 domain-containing protein [Aggregatilineales bacterium]
MNDTLQTIAILVAALFWGGVVTVDFVVTPARFATPGVDRESILAVGQQIFRIYGYFQVAMGVLLLIVVIIGGGDAEVIVPGVFMLILSVINTGILEPAMQALRKPSLSDEQRAANADRFTQMHRAFLVSDIFKIILGVILIATLAAA